MYQNQVERCLQDMLYMEDMRIVQGMFVYRNDIVLLYRLSMYQTKRFCCTGFFVLFVINLIM